MKTTDKKPDPRKITSFKFLSTGSPDLKGFDLFEITELDGTKIVRNLRETSPGLYIDSREFEFQQV